MKASDDLREVQGTYNPPSGMSLLMGDGLKPQSCS